MSVLLRDRAKQDTDTIHRYVERSPLMSTIAYLSADTAATSSFINGYLQYLVDIHAIYRALEEILQFNWISGHSDAVLRDIQTIAGTIAGLPTISIPCQSYIAYLNSIILCSDQNMSRFIAHVYVRVLADLSGGYILKKRLSEHGFPVETYQFPLELKAKILNWINTQATDHTAFIGECHIAFVSYAAMLKC